MTISDTQTVDLVSIEKGSGAVVLTVSDHLDWETPEAHMQLLEDKLNTYLQFVESGQIGEVQADAASRKKIIRVVGKYGLTSEAVAFFHAASEQLRGTGIELTFVRCDDL